jgi:hypothetical protein
LAKIRLSVFLVPLSSFYVLDPLGPLKISLSQIVASNLITFSHPNHTVWKPPLPNLFRIAASDNEIEPSLLCPLTDKLPRVAGGAVDDEFTCHWMPSHSSCISRVTGPAGTPPGDRFLLLIRYSEVVFCIILGIHEIIMELAARKVGVIIVSDDLPELISHLRSGYRSTNSISDAPKGTSTATWLVFAC